MISQAETAAPDAVLLAESREQAGLMGGADQMEVVAATMQRRAPVFK
ncbi:MAG: hypothetical protein AAFV87_15265 [Pseudomonadota bacterium]